MDIKAIEAELDKAFTSRDIGEINRLSAILDNLKKEADAKKAWFDANKEKILETAKAIKDAKTLDEVREALAKGQALFPAPVAAKAAKTAKGAKSAKAEKNVYKWNHEVLKNCQIDPITKAFIQPLVFMRGRYAGNPIK